MSKKHAALVKMDTLAEVGKALNLGEHLLMGKGERNSAGAEKPTILSDAVEAVIAAIYLDGGFEPAQDFITRNWEGRIEKVRYKDPKSRLQEWLQANGHSLPTYKTTAIEGEAHSRIFEVEVHSPALGDARGRGSSKQEAQKAAAEGLLAKLSTRQKRTS